MFMKSGLFGSAKKLSRAGLSAEDARRAGDEARDARRWGEAVSLYDLYLQQNPEDVGIRVQVGNCLKEDGRLSEALDAYEAALKLDDKNADGFLQLGHVLKLLNRKNEAARAYATSLDLAPSGNPALVEVLALQATLDRSPTKVISNEVPTIYVDVTDLIDYLRVNLSLSGIQRVVSNLILHASNASDAPGRWPVRPVLPDYTGAEVFSLDASLLVGLVSSLSVENTSREMLDRALAAVKGSRTPVALKPGDTLLIAGAFWIYQRYDLLNDLRQKGVLVAIFIHDLIQITNPEFVETAATDVFRRSLVDIMNVSSYVLTNSRFVANEVRRYLADRLNFKLPITPVTLATELGNGTSQAQVSSEYTWIAKEDYVLCVGTIEVRKNHMYLIKIWERLIKEFRGSIPNLVFVGKWGWQIDELRKHLDGSDYLGGRLFIYNGISDAELAFLYRNCLMTIYPSFAEGWGLPVGESLGYGKPCLVSKVTSLPEVGGEWCRYFDPFNLDDGYSVVTDALADRAALANWTARIQNEYRPKTWKSFSTELFDVVQSYGSDPGLRGHGNNCIIECGHIATFGNDSLAQLDRRKSKLLTARMTRMSGWHGLEPWGCWAARRRAVLNMATRLKAGTDVFIYLHLKTPDLDESADCKIVVNQTTTIIDDLGPVSTWCVAPGCVGEGGNIEITLVSGRGFFHRHGRELYIGLLGIAVAAKTDLKSQDAIRSQIIRECVPMAQA